MIPSRKISAKFPGKCSSCGASHSWGDTIWYTAGYRALCLTCGPHTEGNSVATQPRGKRRQQQREPAPTPKPATPAPGIQPQTKYLAPTLPDADGVWRITYPSISAAIETAFGTAGVDASTYVATERRLAECLDGNSEWANKATRSSLEAGLSNPPAPLVAAVEAMRDTLLADIALPTRSRRKVRHRREDGDELDAMEVLHRNPDAWDRVEREHQPRQVVSIGVNLSISGCREPHELLYRGAAAVALADVLTQRGQSVEIVGFYCSVGRSTTIGQATERLIVKRADMPLDLPATTFALCEIAFFRVILAKGCAKMVPGYVSGGLGCPVNAWPADAAGCDYMIDADVFTESAARAWLTEKLQPVTA